MTTTKKVKSTNTTVGVRELRQAAAGTQSSTEDIDLKLQRVIANAPADLQEILTDQDDDGILELIGMIETRLTEIDDEALMMDEGRSGEIEDEADDQDADQLAAQAMTFQALGEAENSAQAEIDKLQSQKPQDAQTQWANEPYEASMAQVTSQYEGRLRDFEQLRLRALLRGN
jgi:hypothetical protein